MTGKGGVETVFRTRWAADSADLDLSSKYAAVMDVSGRLSMVDSVLFLRIVSILLCWRLPFLAVGDIMSSPCSITICQFIVTLTCMQPLTWRLWPPASSIFKHRAVTVQSEAVPGPPLTHQNSSRAATNARSRRRL